MDHPLRSGSRFIGPFGGDGPRFFIKIVDGHGRVVENLGPYFGAKAAEVYQRKKEQFRSLKVEAYDEAGGKVLRPEKLAGDGQVIQRRAIDSEKAAKFRAAEAKREEQYRLCAQFGAELDPTATAARVEVRSGRRLHGLVLVDSYSASLPVTVSFTVTEPDVSQVNRLVRDKTFGHRDFDATTQRKDFLISYVEREGHAVAVLWIDPAERWTVLRSPKFRRAIGEHPARATDLSARDAAILNSIQKHRKLKDPVDEAEEAQGLVDAGLISADVGMAGRFTLTERGTDLLRLYKERRPIIDPSANDEDRDHWDY